MPTKSAADVFPAWLKRTGTVAVSDRVGVSRAIVWAWYARRSVPRPETAYALIRMSGGFLDWESIYKPFALNKLRRK